ncbi:hypothetical protein WN48_02796 [Eufriesea mexicana]|uniref:Uncharacterized protein n=1 Tax=Eufriesea mexicana TaxID=516756 RepID=A0A310SB89_9HYME|nr:hypothetical protein WN48_02796 [Eufriesea mexicana]
MGASLLAYEHEDPASVTKIKYDREKRREPYHLPNKQQEQTARAFDCTANRYRSFIVYEGARRLNENSFSNWVTGKSSATTTGRRYRPASLPRRRILAPRANNRNAIDAVRKWQLNMVYSEDRCIVSYAVIPAIGSGEGDA